MRAHCGNGSSRPAAGEVGLRVVVTVGDHPMIGLTAARVLMIVVDELQADGVPVRRVEIGLEGPLPQRLAGP